MPALNFGVDIAVDIPGIAVAGRREDAHGGAVGYSVDGTERWRNTGVEQFLTNILWVDDEQGTTPVVAGHRDTAGTVARLTQGGAVQWKQHYGNDVEARFGQNTLTQEDDGLLLGGWTREGYETQDGYLLAINTDGTKRWSRRFGGSNEEYINRLSVSGDDTVLVAGSSSSYGAGDGLNGYLAGVPRSATTPPPTQGAGGGTGGGIGLEGPGGVEKLVLQAVGVVVGGLLLLSTIGGLIGRDDIEDGGSGQSDDNRQKPDDWDPDEYINEYGERES